MRCITITMVYNAVSVRISDGVRRYIGVLILEAAVSLASSENVAT